MRSPTPSAVSRARAKLVLPAPNGPYRYSTSPPSRANARLSPKAAVAASSGRVQVCSVGSACIGVLVPRIGIAQAAQGLQQVRGQHAAFAVARGQVTGARMQADAKAGRFPRHAALR